jgi:hypothetical protein
LEEELFTSEETDILNERISQWIKIAISNLIQDKNWSEIKTLGLVSVQEKDIKDSSTSIIQDSALIQEKDIKDSIPIPDKDSLEAKNLNLVQEKDIKDSTPIPDKDSLEVKNLNLVLVQEKGIKDSTTTPIQNLDLASVQDKGISQIEDSTKTPIQNKDSAETKGLDSIAIQNKDTSQIRNISPLKNEIGVDCIENLPQTNDLGLNSLQMENSSPIQNNNTSSTSQIRDSGSSPFQGGSSSQIQNNNNTSSTPQIRDSGSSAFQGGNSSQIQNNNNTSSTPQIRDPGSSPFQGGSSSQNKMGLFIPNLRIDLTSPASWHTTPPGTPTSYASLCSPQTVYTSSLPDIFPVYSQEAIDEFLSFPSRIPHPFKPDTEVELTMNHGIMVPLVN